MAIIRGIVEAERTTSPHGLAAQTLGKLFGADARALEENMAEAAKAINGGSLIGVEGVLSSQAIALNAMFHRLTQTACEKPRTPDEFAVWFKIALRAQAQSANALEMLANMKQGPRVVVTGQLNAANQQVVNNGPEPLKPAKVRESASGSKAGTETRALPPNANPLPDLVSSATKPMKKHATLDA